MSLPFAALTSSHLMVFKLHLPAKPDTWKNLSVIVVTLAPVSNKHGTLTPSMFTLSSGVPPIKLVKSKGSSLHWSAVCSLISSRLNSEVVGWVSATFLRLGLRPFTVWPATVKSGCLKMVAWNSSLGSATGVEFLVRSSGRVPPSVLGIPV